MPADVDSFLVVSLGMLFFFKYTNFFIGNINALFGTSFDTLKNIVMPLGISFYTFQTLSYTVDVYRGKVKADKNFIRVGAFVTLFPQLIAGPIVLYTDVDKELKSRRLSLMQIQEGVRILFLAWAKRY